MKKVLLDCDPGVDDALAILLALGEPKKIDVKAIVSTFGNVGLKQTKSNLLRILSFFGPSTSLGVKIPLVGSGSARPLKGKAPLARHVHGEDGLGDLLAPPERRLIKAVFKNGIDLIIKSALSKKIDTIIATGPLTDLATAMKKNPRFLDELDGIVIMGGAVFVKGNVTPYAEFNFCCDPEAARAVLNADVKKTLVSLDVTQKTLLKNKHLEPLKGINTPLSRFIKHLAGYAIYAIGKRGFSGAPMHDPLAVGLAIEPGLGEYENLCVDVETKGKERGKVILKKKGGKNVKFCKRVNVNGFLDLFIGNLVKLAKSGE